MKLAVDDFGSADLAVLNFYNEGPAQQLCAGGLIRGVRGVFGANGREFTRSAPRAGYTVLGNSARCGGRAHRFGASAGWRWRLTAKNLATIGRTLNLPYFSDIERFRRLERSTDCEAGSLRVFLFSGALIRRKGVDLVARAFVRLVREGLPVRLKIMGYGKLEGTVARTLADCQDRVELLGFRDWEVLPEVYAAADVLCVPSRYDGWGLVVPEGLAAGLPVISTAQTGAAVEFIEHGSNGWLIPASDGNAVYRAMRGRRRSIAPSWRRCRPGRGRR